ncbi:hypothetical protein [Thiolapillus sp.]
MAKKKTSARKKPVDSLSSAELYRLAKKREQEEMKKALEANKEKLKALRARRRELVATHRKELAKIEREISRLTGKAATGKRGGGRGSITDAVVKIIGDAGEISTTDLKAALKKKGVVAGNLSQTLAYLKRQGRVTSPARAIYKLAK